MSRVPVLVAGAGPIGLTMAAELTRRGIACRIVEKSPARTDLSKALVVWPRTLELLRQAGAAGAFLAAGRKITATRLYAGSRVLANIGFDQIETPYPFALFVPQSETERLLEEHLGRLGIAVERQIELTDFTPSADGVVASLRRADGQTESVAADYLIGCDGAHSIARHKLGFAFDGVSEQGIWVLGDVKLRNHPHPGELLLFWHGAGVLAIFPMNQDRYRIIADGGNDAATADRSEKSEATMAQIQALLDRRGPGGIEAYDPVWLSFFRINERKVKNYRGGRVFLVGDAAHIHSPAGGQGMNTGMQDAFNLAWKLALTIGGQGGESLLDTYSSERAAVGDMVLRNATRLTHIATLRNKPAREVRNTLAWLLMKLPLFRRLFAAAMTELDIAYPNSALSRQGAGYAGKLKPGDRAPDAHVAAGEMKRVALFDMLNREGFTLLGIGGKAIELPERYADLIETVHLAAEQDVAGELAARYGEGLFLIRPDWYIGLCAAPSDMRAVEDYLSEWLKV
jgi:2-polyprenyl-6-methoxyphenol hydroxylase-like FAD-dependent oxidoreductase